MTPEMKPLHEGPRLEPRPTARLGSLASPVTQGRSVAQLVRILWRSRVLVAAVTVAAILLGIAYVIVKAPTYRSDLVVQVEESTRTLPGVGEVAGGVFSDRSASDTEMEILRSRGLIGAVVDELNLQVVAVPKTFPLLGWMARRYRGKDLAPPRFDLASYAWGGEQIVVQRLDVPEELLERPLTLVAGEDGAYDITTSDGAPVAHGVVGKPAEGAVADQRVELFVSDLRARPGTRFVVTKRARLRVIQEIQTRLSIAERGRKTGVLAVALDGADRHRVARILETIGATYVRRNVEHKSAEAAKTLAFLETQLPILKSNLAGAEAALKGYQVKKGTLDLSREAQAMLTRSVEIEKALSEAEMTRAELRQRFTPNHPALMALSDKIDRLKRDAAAMNARMRDLPGTELDSARLTRDVRVSGELYNVLLNKAQELRVVKSGTIGNVQILDPASVPLSPVAPKPVPVLLLVTLIGLTIGGSVAITRHSLYVGVDDPESLEALTGITAYATIPRSPAEGGTWIGRRDRPIAASASPDDPAVEAIRSLRTGVQFALLERQNNVIVVTGLVSGVGKSFVTVNLAQVMAEAGRRVLVLDGDLRRGGVHRAFHGRRAPGLSDVLTGTASLAEATRPSRHENLQWLPTGTVPRNPSELLASDRFEKILAELRARYDVVLVDTAPVLPVTDAAIVGRHAAITLLVLRAGAHRAAEILAAVKRLSHNGVRVQGAVLNDVSGDAARYGQSTYHYETRYERGA